MKTTHMMLMSWALLAPVFSNAQESKPKTDTTKILNGHLKLMTEEKDGKTKSVSLSLGSKRDSTRKILETSWGSFDIGYNNYVDETDYANISSMSTEDKSFFNHMPNATKSNFELRSGKSVNVNFGLVKFQLSLYKNYINLVSGFTYDINNWSYKKALLWHKEPEFQTTNYQGDYVSMDTVYTYEKNKMVTNYIQLPLLLRFESSPLHKNKNIYFSAGGYVGYRVRVHTKKIIDGENDAIKQYDEFNTTLLQYGTQFELGYQGISVYFKKSLTPLTEYGTMQYPYSFGIRILGL